MKIFEIGTGYTSIPADKGAATEIVVENLSHSLIRQGYDVTVVDIADQNRLATDLPIVEVPMPGSFSGTDEGLGARHKIKRVLYSVRLAKVLRRILRKLPEGERVVLHFHNQYNAYFFYKLVARSLRERAVVAYTVHSYVWHDPWETIEDTVRKRYFQEIDAIRRADVVFVLNSDAARTIEGHVGVDAARVRLIANGVDTEAYRPLPASETAELAESLGLAGKSCVIQVGSVCERKNQLGGLEMLEPLMQENPNIAYIYAGGVIEPEYKKRIDAFAAGHGIADRVKYLGEVAPGKELNMRYNLAKCSLFSTRAEAFSLVVIEAMSAGMPVFVGEQLKVDLEGIVRYKDGDDLRRLIRLDVLDEAACAEIGTGARQIVLNAYSWDKVAANYAESFEDALKLKRAD